MINREQLFRHAKAKQATDIHICANAPVLLRIGGELIPITSEKLSAKQSREISLELLTEEQKIQFEKNLDYDLMLVEESGRYRINIGYFNGEVGAVIRVLPLRAATIKELCLPDIVRGLTGITKGLVLITGSTSQGKTTTLAAMIDEINSTTTVRL